MQRPRLFNPTLELKVNNEKILATQKLDQKLHEDVKHIGFVDVSHCVKYQSFLRKHDRKVCRNRVNLVLIKVRKAYRNDCQNPYDLQLDLRLVKVDEVSCDLIARN